MTPWSLEEVHHLIGLAYSGQLDRMGQIRLAELFHLFLVMAAPEGTYGTYTESGELIELDAGLD